MYTGWLEAFTEMGIRTHEYNLGDRMVFYEHSYLWTGVTDGHQHAQFKKAIRDRSEIVRIAANGILSTAYQFWPDVIIIISAFFIPLDFIDTMRDRGHKVVMLFTESPYEENRQLKRAEHCDLALLNDPLNLAEYDKAGIPAAYMPHAYRPTLHYPGPASLELETDFAFVGTGFETRIQFFEAMAKTGVFERLDVTLAGNWQRARPGSWCYDNLSHDPEECIDNELTARIYRSAKAGFNMYRREAEDDCKTGVAIGPREVEMAACGLFFLRDSRPESDELFPMLPTFSGPEDAAEQLRWWLEHDDERNEAALKARAAIRDRTFTSNATRLLKLLDEL